MADKVDIVVSLKDRMSSGMKKLNKTLLVTKGGVDKLKNAMFGLKAAVVSVAAVFAGKQLIDIANEQAKSVKGMETALRSMGRYTPEFAKKMQDIASNIQSFTNYGDEATLMGQKFLATYVNITDDLLPRVSLAMVDLAALMGGDMTRASNMMGKASMGMVGQLSIAGISIEKGVYEAEGFVGVLGKIENQSRGQAKAQREATGSIVAMGNSFDDVKEKAGDFLKIILEPAFQVVLDRFDALNEKIAKLKEEGKLAEWANDFSTKVMESLRFMVLGTIGVVETIGPIMSNFKVMFTSIWDWFTELPTWVQTSGLVLAIMGGPKVKASIATLAVLTKGVDKIKDEIRLMTFEFSASREEIENYTLKLEALNILKEKFSKTPFFGGEDETEFETRKQKLKEIGEQISIVEQKIRGLTPHKIVDDDSIVEDMGTVREIMTKFFDDLEEKRLLLIAKLDEPKAELGVPKGAKPEAPGRDITAEVQGQLISLEVLYQQGEEKLISYLERRRNLVLLSLQAEIAIMEDAAGEETDVKKKLQAEDQIFIKKQEYALREIELTKAIAQAHEDAVSRKAELEGMFADLKLRASEDVDVAQAEELAKMDERHRLELESFKKLLDDKIAAEMKYIDETDALRDVEASQQIEKDKLLASQRKERIEQQLTDASSLAGGMKTIGSELYEMSGKNNKKMFKLAKAAAIAQAIINGALAVSKANDGTYMGYAKMAIAAALAGIQVAKIRGTEMGGSFAEGGLIPGSSPHSKADNLQINATAGEYVQPISAVKHLGLPIMEGIKRNLFPKDLFSGFALPKPSGMTSGLNYASGGAVGSLAKVAATSPKIEIVNVTNPDAIRGLAMDAVHENRDIVVNMVLQGLEDRNITLQRDYVR